MAKISINIKKGAIEKPKLIVGIDLGTTNSLIAYVPSGSKAPEIIPVRGRKSVPSVLHFDSHGVISVGHYAKEQLISFPEKTIYSIKRLLGKGLNDIPLDHRDLGYVIEEGDDHALIKIGVDGKSYNPIELSAEILKELKKQAEISLNAHIDAAVITVPAYFN
jgi:molecular chaperone HscA